MFQGSHIKIRMNSELPVHVDGEPWIQAPGDIVVLKSALKVRTSWMEMMSLTSVDRWDSRCCCFRTCTTAYQYVASHVVKGGWRFLQ
jgi:hypothetical protein